MLTDQDKTDLRKLDAAGTKLAITQQIQRVHIAVNSGTLDRATVADALDRLTVLTRIDQDGPTNALEPPPKPVLHEPAP